MPKAKKLPSGNWRARVTFTNEDGTRSSKSFTAPSKKEAEMLAAQYSYNHKQTVKSNLTLKEAGERYISTKQNIISPATVRGYKSILANDVPELFSQKLADLTQEKFQGAINRFSLNHSPKTCRNVCGFITAIISVYAPELHFKITLPQKVKSDIYVPDTDEVHQIEEWARGTASEIPVFLAAECGLRASEIAGLLTKNITDNYIYIREVRVIGEGNKEYIKDPKSYSGTRKIPITPDVAEYLRKSAVNERVCPRRSVNISNNWAKFQKSHCLDEDFNFHALRHHYASKCLLLGIPQKYIADLMGHADTEMIEKVYQHIFPSAMEEFARRIREQIPQVTCHETCHEADETAI